jgi:DNA-directed RNA polymerase I, II, and III subunit RPABC1
MDGYPPLFVVRRNIIAMMAAREYIVEQQEKTPEEYARDFCTEEDGRLYVNRDALTLSLVHAVTRLPMRVFFFSSNKTGGNLGKKEVETILGRMGDAVVRAMIVVPDGSKPTSHAKKMMDEMNRGTPLLTQPGGGGGVFIQWFFESELSVNIVGCGTKIERKFRIMHNQHEREALLRKYRIKEKFLPFISWDDPLARYYGLQKGDILECVRASESAGRYIRYQVCVYTEEAPKETKPPPKKPKN